MPIRNPFARRVGANVHDEDVAPPSPPGFERVDTVGSKGSSALSIRSARSQDTGEYQLSVVNDSGVFLPPSPPPADQSPRGTWPRRYLSVRESSDSGSGLGDIEHFSISRESFDSYRRSFDISAKSPVIISEAPARQSLDSARFPRLPRSAIGNRSNFSEISTEEEDFEDVGLDGTDEQKPQPRRHGFFSKFLDSQDKEAGATGGSHMTRYLMPGRKRGQSQSGMGSELGTVERPIPSNPLSVQEV